MASGRATAAGQMSDVEHPLWAAAESAIQSQLHEFEEQLRASLAAERGEDAFHLSPQMEHLFAAHSPALDSGWDEPARRLESAFRAAAAEHLAVALDRGAVRDAELLVGEGSAFEISVEETIQRQLREFEHDLRLDMMAERQARPVGGSSPGRGREVLDGSASVERITAAMEARLQQFGAEAPQQRLPGSRAELPAHDVATQVCRQQAWPVLDQLVAAEARGLLPQVPSFSATVGGGSRKLACAGEDLLQTDSEALEQFVQQQLELFEEQLWQEVGPTGRERSLPQVTLFVQEQVQAFEQQLREVVFPIEPGISTINQPSLGLVRKGPMSAEELVEKAVQDYETTLRVGAVASRTPHSEQGRLLVPFSGAGSLPSGASEAEAAWEASRQREEREAAERKLRAIKDRNRDATVRNAAAVFIQKMYRGRAARTVYFAEMRRRQAEQELRAMELQAAAHAEQALEAKRREEELEAAQEQYRIRLEYQRGKEREATLRRLQQIEDRRRELAAIKIQGLQRGHRARIEVQMRRLQLRDEAEQLRAHQEREAEELRVRLEEADRRRREAERAQELEATRARLQLLEDRRRNGAAVTLQSFVRGVRARVGCKAARQLKLAQEEARAEQRRIARLQADKLQRERQERARLAQEVVRRESLEQTSEHKAPLPTSFPGLEQSWRCRCAGCSPGKGVDTVEQLRLLVKLGEDSYRCHRCDVGAVKLYSLLRALGRVCAMVHGSLRSQRPNDITGPELLSQLVELLEPVLSLDPQLGDVVAHVEKEGRLQGSSRSRMLEQR